MSLKDIESIEDIKKLIKQRGITRVKLAATDIDGVLRGKYINTKKFFSALDNKLGFCDVIFGWDSEDELYKEDSITGWRDAYPDAMATIDIKSCREFEDIGDNYTKANESKIANMLVAAMMGATAFQKGLGSVHSLAHTLGGLYNMPHGLANSIILPYALKQNSDAIEEKMEKLCRFLDIPNPSTQSFINFILSLREMLEIPHTLKEAKIPNEKAEEIGKTAYNDPSTGTNAKKLTPKDFTELFVNCYEGTL